MMKNKAILVSALALLATLTVAFAGSGSTAFTIAIQVDTTITLPTLCENQNGSSTNAAKLDFEPGISGLNDGPARALDTCADGGAGGDWNVTMTGNVPIDLNFKLSAAAPTGIVISLNNDVAEPDPFQDSTELNLTISDQQPAWANDLVDASTLEIWQRIAADTTATGATNTTDLTVVITSSYVPT